ncbi:MAG: SufE family protein [Pseudomonadales bacterium]|nr:SufE family protein [Pseudomonadales bacterium]
MGCNPHRPLPDLGEIREAFAFFDDWEDKYRFVIDLGKSLPELPQADRSEANLVRGCQSQVWMVASQDPATNALHFRIDSDAHIVRGLIAIVLAVYDGQSPESVLKFDIEALFDELKLLPHLSVTRGNGLRAMIRKIQAFARERLA